MNLIVDGRLISYDDIGKKTAKPVLFLHGWADSSATFEGLASELADKYRCISIDLPGFGGSEPPKEAWDISDFSDLLEKFLKKLQIKPYAVIGHSNGGAIAINAISSRILSADKLVLLASSGIRTGQRFKKTAYKIAAQPVKAAISILPEGKRNTLKRKLYTRIGSDYMVAGHMKDTFRKVVSHDIAAEAAQLELPVLLIYGKEDAATPPEIGRKLQEQIKDSQLVLLEDSGHFIHKEQGEEVLKLIKGFLK